MRHNPHDEEVDEIFRTWEEEDECPVCGVPVGTGACRRCLLIAAEVFELEDYMDGL